MNTEWVTVVVVKSRVVQGFLAQLKPVITDLFLDLKLGPLVNGFKRAENTIWAGFAWSDAGGP